MLFKEFMLANLKLCLRRLVKLLVAALKIIKPLLVEVKLFFFIIFFLLIIGIYLTENLNIILENLTFKESFALFAGGKIY